MPDPITLPDETVRQIERLGPVDFIVGVASHNNAGTIAAVVQAAVAGLEQTCPGARVAVVQADIGSQDATVERARAAIGDRIVQAPVAVDRVTRLAPTLAVRADALRVVFAIAERLGVRGCAVLEPDTVTVASDGVPRLLGPVAADQADFVAPCYTRHRFAGAITTSIVYPFVRAVYGKRVRYPVGTEFGCSRRLILRYLGTDMWKTDVARLGIDISLVIQALMSGWRLAQTNLGVKTETAGDGLDLSGTLARVLGALFLEAERTVAVWQKVRGSEVVPVTGGDGSVAVEPVVLDAQRALESFRLGERNFRDIWAPVLPPLALLELQKLSRQPDATFRVPDALWARIIYDFALAYHARVMNRDHLLSAFTPLYSGWLASWIGEMQSAADAEVDARIERLCVRFEAEKPYFISRWRSPDRFSP